MTIPAKAAVGAHSWVGRLTFASAYRRQSNVARSSSCATDALLFAHSARSISVAVLKRI